MHAWIRQTCLSVLLFAGLFIPAAAQDAEPKPLIQRPAVPAHLGGRPEQDALWRQAQPTPAASRPVNRPTVITPPDDNVYVGVIDSTFFSKAEMDLRVNRLLVMSDAVGWKDMEAREKLRRNLEQMVLTEWAELKLMAIHAQKEGHQASEAEIQEKLNEVYQQEQQTPELARTMKAVGITRNELVDYVREGILAEKLIGSYMKKYLTEQDLKNVYQMLPDMFKTPARVELNYMAMRLSGEETLADKRRLKETMDEWRKKAAKKGKFKEVAEDFTEPELGQAGGYYGWVSPRSLPRDDSSKSGKNQASITVQSRSKIVDAVFGMKKGEVSEVLSSEKGFYVFQLIDKKEAGGTEYDTAKPMVESAVYERVKASVLGQIVPQHTIYMAPGGIDFKAIAEAKKNSKDLKAYREEQRKQRFFEHFGDRIIAAEESTSPRQAVMESGGGPLSTQISPRSLQILQRGSTAASRPLQVMNP